MSEIISVYSTVAQAENFEVETNEGLLLQERYFGTSEGDLFVGKEVCFDFEDRDMEKGAFLTTTYKNGETVNWIANSVIPPRVAISDSVDPKNLDRILFERLCRAQGADLNRSSAHQELLTIKAVRLAARCKRSIELIIGLILENGCLQFSQRHDNVSGDTDTIDVRYFDAVHGANNHCLLKTPWTDVNAHPYDDVCEMVTKIFAEGSYAEDLLMGDAAWARLIKDDAFKLQYTAIHTEDSVLFARDINKAAHVGSGVFNGRKLNLIVYSGQCKDNGVARPYIDPNAVILISPNVGRTLCGGVTLLNPASIGYDIDSAFMDGRGKIIESLYKDFDNQVITLRAESRPLPAPRNSINTYPWIYCRTDIGDSSLSGNAFGPVVTLEYEYHDRDGAVVTPTTPATEVRNQLGGSDLSMTNPTLTSQTFDHFEIDGVVWDGTKVPMASAKVVALFK